MIREALSYSDSDEVGVARALGGSDELSVNDQNVIAGLGSHVQRFNAAALRLVTTYNDAATTHNDPTTDYNDRTLAVFIWGGASADRHIKEMYAAATAMRSDILSIEDDGVRETFLAIADTMRDEASAMNELQSATHTMSGYLKAERRALRHLQRAAAHRQQLGIELLDRLRPYVDPATLREILQSAANQGTLFGSGSWVAKR